MVTRPHAQMIDRAGRATRPPKPPHCQPTSPLAHWPTALRRREIIMKQFKVAVLRARHDASVGVIPERACLDMVMNNGHHSSVLNYWASVTDGHLNFVGSTMFPWVDITMGADDVSRETQCARAFEATMALNGGDLQDFDAYLVLTLPGQFSLPNPKAGQPGQPARISVNFDGGAGAVVQGKPACAVPVMTSNHTFICHELGHMMGWNHSYGVLNNGTDWDGKAPFDVNAVYGDPYDIMSSASFGSRTLDPDVKHYTGQPAFTGWPVDGWPNPSASTMGPAPARAHLHLWDPQALAPQRVRHFAQPFVGEAQRFTLTAAGRHSGVQLAVLHAFGEDAEGRGRCYVEYRQKGGWDAGLDESGNDLARQGVVVHALADTEEGVRCWYRGRILVPVELDTDLTVSGTALQVRVLSADLDSATVDIEVTARLERGVELRSRGGDEVLTVINPQPMSTPCGDALTYGTWITSTRTFHQPVSIGFGGVGAPDAGRLLARWVVAGVPVTGTDGVIQAPTTEGVFAIEYVLHPETAELRLWSRGGERYRVDVTVAVSEADGSGTRHATAVFSAKGWYDGYGPGDTARLARCLSRYARRAHLRLRDFLIPPGPGPVEREIGDRINQRRLQLAIALVADAYPGPATALTALTAMRYGVGQR